ncbi:YheE family protein [Bacillus alveayuensis]|jgi:hypothetical protein|uniref:YheE family protein n=1 Tax=Aeribacillus alveayuensis TaxID=279215 RepID=UPI0005D11058|nr:YheE family protein [Bacillus alveayuensis]
MITHFQYNPLVKQTTLPGWRISFFFNGIHYNAIYHSNGEIEWGHVLPPKEQESKIKEQIHELMLFHIYE